MAPRTHKCIAYDPSTERLCQKQIEVGRKDATCGRPSCIVTAAKYCCSDMTTNYIKLVAEQPCIVTAQQREMNKQLIDIMYRRDLEAASNAQVLRHRELIEQELAEEAANAKDLSESEIAAIKAANKVTSISIPLSSLLQFA